MSGDHNQYQKPASQCDRCGEANPAEIHTCTPKQEPVGWLMKPNEDIQPEYGWLKSHVVEKIPEDWNGYHAVPLYTAPPQREWQRLTDKEVFDVENAVPDEVITDRDWCLHFARAIEDKLKEKNT